MKKWLCLMCIFVIAACQNAPDIKSPRPEPADEEERMIPLEEYINPAEAVVPLPARDCGAVEVDPETGDRITVPDVDLVISSAEVLTTERGTWILPTVKNLCEGTAEGLFNLLIRSSAPGDVGVVVIMGNVPGGAEVSLGHAVGVPNADRYTLTVDYDHRIPEANEGNNRCVVTESGTCR